MRYGGINSSSAVNFIRNVDAVMDQVLPQEVPPDRLYEAMFSRGGVMVGVIGAGVLSWLKGESVFSDTTAGAIAGTVGGLIVGRATGSIVDLCCNRGRPCREVARAAGWDIEAQENLISGRDEGPAGFDPNGRYALSVVRLDASRAETDRYWGWGGQVAGAALNRVWAALRSPQPAADQGSSSTSQ